MNELFCDIRFSSHTSEHFISVPNFRAFSLIVCLSHFKRWYEYMRWTYEHCCLLEWCAGAYLYTRLNGVTGQNELDLFGTGPVHIPAMTPAIVTKVSFPGLFRRMAGHFLQRWRPSVILPFHAVSQDVSTVLSAIGDQLHMHIYLLPDLRAGDTDVSVRSWGWGGHGAQVLQWSCDVPRSTVPTARASDSAKHHTSTGKAIPSSGPTRKTPHLYS